MKLQLTYQVPGEAYRHITNTGSIDGYRTLQEHNLLREAGRHIGKYIKFTEVPRHEFYDPLGDEDARRYRLEAVAFDAQEWYDFKLKLKVLLLDLDVTTFKHIGEMIKNLELHGDQNHNELQ